MPTILSQRDIECLLLGHRIEGWSNEDPPIEFPEINFLDVQEGRDGSIYGTDTGILGGEVKFKLHPASRSALWFLVRLQERNRGVRRIFSGTYSNAALGYSCTFKGGLLKMMRPMIVQGQTFEPVIHFEQIIPDTEGAVFDPAPGV